MFKYQLILVLKLEMSLTCSFSREVLEIENLLGSQTSLFPLTPSLTTLSSPSLPYHPNLPPTPPLHHFPFPSHLLLVISSQNAIGGINHPFLCSFISFTLFTFPSASYWMFLLLLHWLPCHFYRCVIAATISFNHARMIVLKTSQHEMLRLIY